MERREWLRGGLATGTLLLASRRLAPAATEAGTRVVVVKTEEHADGVNRALRLLRADGFARKHVVVKPNFNSADPFPGSTLDPCWAVTNPGGGTSSVGGDHLTLSVPSGSAHDCWNATAGCTRAGSPSRSKTPGASRRRC